MAQRKAEDDLEEERKLSKRRGVFDGLVIYINGSTHPLISDHKLKHILTENGAKLSLHLGRRQVTHVVLGRPSGGQGIGAGGGLSATKIEKEIRRVGGCGVKYVGVEWCVAMPSNDVFRTNVLCRVLESVKMGKRISETPYTNLKVAAKSQQSVYGMFKKTPILGSNEGSSYHP